MSLYALYTKLYGEPAYSPDTGAVMNASAFRYEQEIDMFCGHYDGFNYDKATWYWCPQCQRFECPKCQHEEI